MAAIITDEQAAALVEFLTGPSVGTMSIMLELPSGGPLHKTGARFFALREMFGARGYVTTDSVLEPMKERVAWQRAEACKAFEDFMDAVIKGKRGPSRDDVKRYINRIGEEA